MRNFLKKGCSPALSAKWVPTDPVYGSEAYQASGAELAQVAHEIMSADLAPQEERQLLVAAGCLV